MGSDCFSSNTLHASYLKGLYFLYFNIRITFCYESVNDFIIYLYLILTHSRKLFSSFRWLDSVLDCVPTFRLLHKCFSVMKILFFLQNSFVGQFFMIVYVAHEASHFYYLLRSFPFASVLFYANSSVTKKKGLAERLCC